MAESPGRILSKQQIEKLAACGKRFELTRDMLKFVQKGTRSLADVAQVGPANIEKCKMKAQEWDRLMKSREDNGQCKGTFFTSFHKTNSFRRCEVAVQPGKSVCELCKRMREKARKDGLDIVSCDGQPEYKIVQKALFARPGVVASMKWWQDQAEEIKKKHKLQKQFPFFSAQEMVTWLMIEGGAIFSNGGKGGRVYRRSALVVEAQDEYLKECMENSLVILRFESKKNFKKRMRKIMAAAETINTQMIEANVGSDMIQVGAIQKPDVVRDELARAARFMERTKAVANVFSVYGRRLDEWARERARREKSGSSPSTSISSSSPSPSKPTRMKASATKPQLKMSKVQDKMRATNTAVMASESDELRKGVMPFKKFEIKESTIPGAGKGFFLKEGAQHGEAIARYSGKLLSKKETVKSSSEYIIRISEDKYLCAEGKDEWEGKYINCARKARRTVNARFQANGKCSYCQVSKKFYIKVFAVGRIEPGEEAFVDYNRAYWCDETGRIEQLPTPKSNYQSDEESNAFSEHSEYRPSGAESADGHNERGKGVAAELTFSSPEGSPSRSEDDSKQKKEGPLRRASRLKLMRVKKEVAKRMQQMNEVGSEEHDDKKGYMSSGNEEGEEGRDDEEGSDDTGNGNDGDGDEDNDDEVNDEQEENHRMNQYKETHVGFGTNMQSLEVNGRSDLNGEMHEADGREDENREDGNGDESDGNEGGDDDMNAHESSNADGKEDDDGNDKDEQDEEKGIGFRTVAMTPRRVYAVAVGRCVGIFRSAVRMRSSVFRYPGCKYKKFASERDAERFLIQQGVQAPVRYWEAKFPSGVLVQHPHSVNGRDVCFPVGIGVTSKVIRHGVIIKPIFRDDQWVWEVSMDHGQVDYMSEWPLLCGLHLAEAREVGYAMEPTPVSKVNATGARSSRKTRAEGSTPLMTDTRAGRYQKITRSEPQVLYAVRGTRKEGIVTNISEVFARMVGPDAEYEEFDTRREAQQWIDELHQVWAVRFANGDTQIVNMSDIKQVTRGQKGIRIVGPTSKTQAQKTVETWGEEMKIREGRIRHKEVQQVIDMTSQDACIARMKDGSVCGRKVNITYTLIGPLCGEHVELYKGEDARNDDDDDGKHKKREVEGRHSTKKTSVKRVVQKSQPQETSQLMSPDEGVLMPANKAALQRDRRGLHSVVAVRTFVDKEVGTSPAGSVWLSLDRASIAKGKKGEMRVFDTHGDVFMNMEEAKTWVEAQVQADSESELESEADKRWQEAQEKAKNERKKKKESNRKKDTSKSHKPPKRVDKKGKKKESRSKDDNEDDDEQSADEPLEGASRRFRRSRRRRRESRGGLRSGALKMLDKQQKRIEEQLFPDDALEVVIYEEAVPEIKLIQKIPLPGKAQALTVGKDAGHVLSFANDMKAVLAERTFRSFDAFSLSDLLEFQQVVDYVASYQPEENKRVTDSVVEGVKVIVNNAVSLHATMRDSDSLGAYGENFKADTYLQVMCLVMFREVYEGSLAELFFWNYAPKFAVKARGCPGMAPWKDPKVATNSEKAKSKDRCLLCGKTGHRADSDVHKQELAEGSRSTSPDQLQLALAQVAQDSNLSVEQKKLWSSRIRGFWGKLSAKDRDASDL